RCHRRAVDAIAPGLRADVDDRVAHPGSGPPKNLVRRQHPGGENVHQAIAVVARVEGDLPADSRNADAVAVAGDPRHHSLEQVARLRMARIAKAQRIEQGDRAGAHGEHVAQDPADPGCRPLVWLDVARMVVALHLEGHRQPIADRHHTGILARSDEYLGTGGGELLQVLSRRLVGAVLAPHHREDPQLEQVRLPPELIADAAVLVRLEPMRTDHLFAMNHWAQLPRSDSKIRRPSSLPKIDSEARSGCGISPKTFPAELITPAMFAREPFGLSMYRKTIWPSPSSRRSPSSSMK